MAQASGVLSGAAGLNVLGHLFLRLTRSARFHGAHPKSDKRYEATRTCWQNVAAGVAVGLGKARVMSLCHARARCSFLQPPGEGVRAAELSPASPPHPCRIPHPARAQHAQGCALAMPPRLPAGFDAPVACLQPRTTYTTSSAAWQAGIYPLL